MSAGDGAVWDLVVQSDPEGNGPGHVDIVPLNKAAERRTDARGNVEDI